MTERGGRGARVAFAWCLLAGWALGGCVQPCKQGTLLVEVQLGVEALGADALVLAVVVAGGEPKQSPIALPAGTLSGTIEVGFDHYPQGQPVQVYVLAARAGQLIAWGVTDVAVAEACEVVRVAVGGATMPTPSSYADAVLVDEPLAYYRLAETTGPVARDSSSHHLDGTYLGLPGFGRPSAVGESGDHAIGLPTTGSGVSTPAGSFAFSANQPYSLEGWVAPALLDDEYRHLVGCYDLADPPGYQGYGIYFRKGAGIVFERYVDGVSIATASTADPALSVLTHVVATYDGAALRLYLDGVLIGERIDGRVGPKRAALLTIGQFGGGGAKFLVGDLDEVAIYDHALSAARVAEHHRVGKLPR